MAACAWLDAVLLQQLAQLAFRHRAGETIDDLPALDQEYGGDRADLEGGGDFLFLVHVDFGKTEGAVVFAGQLFQDRAKGLARPAPGGPEIDQHRGLQGLLQDFGLEGLGGGVENVGLVGHVGLVQKSWR